MTPRCPVYGVACSTAYQKRGCRCPACTEENRAHSERQRRKRGAQVTLSKREDVVMCPITGQSPPTSYRDGCRCPVCMTFNRDKARAQRARAHKAKGKPLTNRMILTRYGDSMKEFEEAILSDVGITIAIARAAAEAYELHVSRNSVRE